MSNEGRSARCHFIKNTPHRPDIALAIIGKVGPNFRAGIIGSPCLSARQATLADFAHI